MAEQVPGWERARGHQKTAHWQPIGLQWAVKRCCLYTQLWLCFSCST